MQIFPQARWQEAFSRGQLQSKLWAIHETQKILPPISQAVICAGWYGQLAALWKTQTHCKVHHFISVDRESFCTQVAQVLQQTLAAKGEFNAVTADILKMDYSSQDLIINTSCEHLSFDEWEYWWQLIPKGTWMLLQSNNFFEDPEHVRCVDSLDDFIKQAPLAEIFYRGKLQLSKYTRFMLIGKK